MTDDTSVLVVEDNAELAELYASWTPKEWSVETVMSGDEAVPAVDESTDVVVLDRRLPGCSGDEVLERLRDRGYDGQVVIVTAVEPDFDIVEMGFDDYLVKPVTRETFERTLERLLARSAYATELREYYAAVSKLSVLEAHKSSDELSASAEYDRLVERAAAHRERADELLEELLSDPSTQTRLFRGLIESAME
ncbi:response regulator [Halorubellus sp. JP-L1]|uniref:response regulator transcription factor n=1 Tax=Halorubellus sp. JP-L1 TaxID=2715753 RepID=UPI00140BDC32|nr:response regulator [Halorubellus sp. JP-L1]NHN43458.1 response regulator [Halorubellus sp. JP-L1]